MAKNAKNRIAKENGLQKCRIVHASQLKTPGREK
jgi:hypothetical protein